MNDCTEVAMQNNGDMTTSPNSGEFDGEMINRICILSKQNINSLSNPAE